jgi:stage V sporulation protein B
LGAAALGFGAFGAASGVAAAALVVLVVALWVVGTGRSGSGSLPWKGWLLLMAPLWLYQLCLNLTLQVDLAVLKGNVAAIAQGAGMAATEAADTASRYAGLYRAAQTFAFVPYQLILSVTFVVFPMVSQAVSLGDADATRAYVRGAMRFSLLVLLAIAAPVSGAAAGVMRIAYPDAYLGGAEALAVLSLGMVCFALFVIGATILSGAGKPGTAAAIAVVTVLFVVSGNVVLVRMAGIGEGTLMAAATATSCGTLFALIAVGIAVARNFGAFLPVGSTLRMLVAATIGWTAAHLTPSGTALMALLALVVGGVAYLMSLAVLREIGASELAIVRKVLKR